MQGFKTSHHLMVSSSMAAIGGPYCSDITQHSDAVIFCRVRGGATNTTGVNNGAVVLRVLSGSYLEYIDPSSDQQAKVW